MSEQPGYILHPTVHGETIVFVSEDALWSVSTTGGVARRLTAGPGMSRHPRFSPDGEWIAYTSQDEGMPNAFVMESAGGPPRRLTWLEGGVRTVGWSKDGTHVVFASNRRQPFAGMQSLYQVELRGSPVFDLGLGLCREISYEPRGDGLVLGINTQDPARWKRYRGGTAGKLWIDRHGDGDLKHLIRLESNLAAPMWIGARIYFLSDHEGYANLYSCTPAGGDLRRHTHHEDFYARFPSTDGKRIVYHAGAELFLFDTATDKAQNVRVSLNSPRHERSRKFVSAANYLEHAALHPKGLALAATARGGAFSMPLWVGAPRRHGETSAVRYRMTSWLGDGEHLVATSDEKGEEGLAIFRADGGKPKGKLRAHISLDIGRVLSLTPAPAGAARVAITNNRQELRLVDLTTGKGRVIEKSKHDRIAGVAWSPDGRWLAYGFWTTRRTCSLHLYDTRSRSIHAITRADFRDVSPSFDPEGRYLYFISMRDFDPVYDSHYFDLGFPRGGRPHLITLRAETTSPFASTTRPARAPGEAEAAPLDAAAKKKKKASDKLEVKIDFAGIEDRVVAFPVEEGRYEKVAGAKGRVYFTSLPIEGSLSQSWASGGAPGAKEHLEYYDLDRQRTESFLRGVSDFSMSSSANTLLVRVGNRLRALAASADISDLSARGEPGRDSGWIDLERLLVTVIPGDEWRQMFREAWRLQRDQFWNEDMSAIDWKKIHDRYIGLVDRVACRAEFSDLMWEMQGELGTSHCYELGGDYRPRPRWHQGLLGADLQLDMSTGAWRVAHIPRGDSWLAHAASPLAAPGLGVEIGDQVLEIAGQQVSRDMPPDRCLLNQAGCDVTVTLKKKNGSTKQIVVRTLASDQPLRYREWVEKNREWVHKKSKGRVGYVHVPNMGPSGYAEFHRYYKVEVDHAGLIIDVRFNGGGHVSQLLLEKLMRRRIGYDASRWQGAMPYPDEAPMGPMVALTNEFAGSDGDIFSHCFKLLKLGQLIGTRTWGGVVGIWPRHALVDGTITTQPEFSFWFQDVGWGVENYGTDPDIEVEIRPQDWAAGLDPQLERGLAEVEALIRRDQPRVPPLDQRPRLHPPRLPKA